MLVNIERFKFTELSCHYLCFMISWGIPFYVGPREGTKDDFWRMVWQEDVETIVMLVDKAETEQVHILLMQ